MKSLLAVVVVVMLGLTACSNEEVKSVPKVSNEKGGALNEKPSFQRPAAPSAVVNSVSLDGVWKTKCMNGAVQTKYQPYIGVIEIQGDEFIQTWTSFSDENCTIKSDEDFTIPFDFTIGNEVRTNVKEFDISYDYVVNNVRYQGKIYNIISVVGNSLKFYPLYEVASDEFDGTTPEKRFQTFLNKTINAEDVYSRE